MTSNADCDARLYEHLPQNRIDARFIDHKEKSGRMMKRMWASEMQFPGFCVKQHTIIIDVLGRWSREVDLSLRPLFEDRGGEILRRMQKALIIEFDQSLQSFGISSRSTYIEILSG